MRSAAGTTASTSFIALARLSRSWSPLSRNCSASAGGIMRPTRCVPPAPGNRPILTSGSPTRVLLVVGGDALMAGEAELEAAAERGAVDRRDPRLAGGFQPPIELRQLAALLEQFGDRGFVALRLGEFGEGAAQAFKQREVGAAAEGVLARGDDRALDRGVGRDLFHDAGKLRHHRHVDQVHRPAGHVPGDERDALAIDVELEVGGASEPSVDAIDVTP